MSSPCTAGPAPARSGASDPWADAITAFGIAVGALLVLAATLGDYGMAWDEGYTLRREELVQKWFHLAASGGSQSAAAWSPATIHQYWPFSRQEPDGHPPFYALLGLAGWLVVHHVLPPLEAYRFGPAALFALTLGAIYWFMARRYGRLAGWMAAAGLLTMPRVFAHAHLASYDIPTLCLWFLSIAAFLMAVESSPGRDPARPDAGNPSGSRFGVGTGTSMPGVIRSRSSGAKTRASQLAPPPNPSSRLTLRGAWAIGFGIAMGCAAATKFTGWFLPFPLLIWAAIYRDRRAVRTLLIGGVAAIVVMYLLNPPWWHHPIRGVMVFLRSNLTRRATRPVPTWFLGRFYEFSLPWYNTLVWTGIVVPAGTLALALLGIGRILWGRLQDRAGTLLLGCWAFFMVLRGLPNAPGHDGVRQFLAAFVFLACLAGVGAAGLPEVFVRIGRRLGERGHPARSHPCGPDARAPGAAPALAAGVVVAGVIAGGAWSTWLYHPLQLSYYNSLIGGLSGAARAGMEPTYYWDAVTPDVWQWINSHTAAGRTVRFTNTIPTFEYLHAWGLLRPSPLPGDPRLIQWYILQNRPGEMHDPALGLDLFLLEHARPAYVKSLAVAPDVPLVAVYSMDDVWAALRQRSRPAAGGPPEP